MTAAEAPVRAVAPDGDRAQPPRHRRLALGAGLTGLFLLLAVLMAFPSIRQFRHATPGDYGDSFVIQWILSWDVHGLLSRSESVLHTNIFWPTRDTLLYSDTGLATVPVSAPLALLFGWPITFNILYLAGWVISLASTYALARWLGASRPGAVLAGVVFTFAAVRLGHYGHFQLGFAFLVPLIILLLLRFFEEQRWWQPVAIGVGCAAIFLNAGYIAVILFPTLVVVVLGWLFATRFRPGARVLIGLAAMGIIALGLSAPILREYRALGDDLRRPYSQDLAVTPKGFLSPAEGSILYGWLDRATHSEFENKLFPGFLAVVLGTVGLVAVARPRRRAAPPDGPPAPGAPATPTRIPDLRRRGLLLVLLSSPIGLLLSFGKYQSVAGVTVTLPYTWVSGLPGFQSIRAFGRFTVIPLLALALLAAFGYDRLLAGRAPNVQVVAAVVLGVVMLLEYHAKVVMSPRVDTPAFSAVNHALADLPRGPVVELPMGDSRNYTWGFVEAPRMVLSTIDWYPRVNGYSGYSPPGYEKTIDAMNSLDDGGPATPEALATLDSFGVRYLVIRTAPLDGVTANVGLSFEDQAGADRIVASLPPERVEGVERKGAAVLVRLRPSATP